MFADGIQFREKIKFQFEFIKKNLCFYCCVSRINILRTQAERKSLINDVPLIQIVEIFCSLENSFS